MQCSNLKSSGGTITLPTTLSRRTANFFITLHLPTAITASHWKAQNEIREEQACHELLSPSAHLLLIISVKRTIQSHAGPVMWRGWINFTASQVSLGFSCDSHELLISTIVGIPHCAQGKPDHFQMFPCIHLVYFQSNTCLLLFSDWFSRILTG